MLAETAAAAALEDASLDLVAAVAEEAAASVALVEAMPACAAAVLAEVAASAALVDAVDAFCEGIGFTPAQTRRMFEAARALGLPVKLHADQLSDLGGAALAAGFDGLSADHIEYTSDDGVRAMAARPCARRRLAPIIAA